MSKYSFETTTVAEMVDNPKIRALVEEMAPELLEHPLLEAGREFTVEDAFPYFADMVTDEAVEEFKRKLALIED